MAKTYNAIATNFIVNMFPITYITRPIKARHCRYFTDAKSITTYAYTTNLTVSQTDRSIHSTVWRSDRL